MKYIVGVLLLLANTALAQRPATPQTVYASYSNDEDSILFRWRPAQGAAAYKIVAGIESGKKKPRYLLLAQTGDTTAWISVKDYRKLDESQPEGCRLNNNFYLIAVNKRRESQAVPFKFLWTGK